MSEQVPEPVIAALTYVGLDEISDEAWALLAAYWVALADFESLTEWLDGFVDLLLELVLSAEETGYVAGSEAMPTSDLLIPEVSEGHTWRKIKGFDPDEAQEAMEQVTTPREEPALRDRLEKAVVSLVEDEASPKKVERMVRNEVVQAAVEGQSRALGERTDIIGWRRAVEPDCCAICMYLWKEGYVYELDQPMWTHTGCRCSKVPTTDRLGRHKVEDKAGQALLDRYYSETLDETTFRRTPKFNQQEAQ